VLVLVLMGGSAAAGFAVGVGVGGVGTISDVISGADGFTLDGALGSDDVPGLYGTDTRAESGPPLAVGARLTGSLVEGPVEHGLTVGGGSVAIEVVEADFDSVLVLLERDGTVITADDDGGIDTLSRIDVELDEGTYLLRVQPWGGGSGGYTVAVE
jgi:hypothetical protein